VVKEIQVIFGSIAMRILLVTTIILFLTILVNFGNSAINPSFSNGSSNTADTNSFYLGGIQVNEANQNKWVKTLQASGMNTVEVTVYAKQGDWDSDNLWFDEVDEGVLKEIRAARKRGMKVVLILRVALDHAFPRNKFLWHGLILPKSDELIDSWFKKYEIFVNKWATIAAEEGVEVLSVGSEMNALSATLPISKMPKLYRYYKSKTAQNFHERRVLKFEDELKEKHLWVRGNDNYQTLELYIEDKINVHLAWVKQATFDKQPDAIGLMNERRIRVNTHWENIIKQTRAVFSGKLTYAANFDNYLEVGFWDQLDFMGINAYFPLRDPSVTFSSRKELKAELIKGWEVVFDEVNEFRQAQNLTNKPLFFTELGYTFRKHSTIEPWSSDGFSVVGARGKEQLIVWKEEPVDQKERATAVDALYETVEKNKIDLQGLLYWKLSTHEYHDDVEPFVLHINKKATDKLQNALRRFVVK
jgi:flavodoxin